MVNPLIGAKMEPLSGSFDLEPSTAVTTTTAGFVKLEMDRDIAEEKVEVKMEMLGDLFGDNFGNINSLLLSDMTDTPLNFPPNSSAHSNSPTVINPMTMSNGQLSSAISSLASSIVGTSVGGMTYSLADIAVAAAAQAQAAAANQSIQHQISGASPQPTFIRTVKLPLGGSSDADTEMADGNYPVLSIPASYTSSHTSLLSPTASIDGGNSNLSDNNNSSGLTVTNRGSNGGMLHISISPISHGGAGPAAADTTSLTSPCSTPSAITPNASTTSSSSGSSKKTICTAKGAFLFSSLSFL
jgi:hypothetical protein